MIKLTITAEGAGEPTRNCSVELIPHYALDRLERQRLKADRRSIDIESVGDTIIMRYVINGRCIEDVYDFSDPRPANSVVDQIRSIFAHA